MAHTLILILKFGDLRRARGPRNGTISMNEATESDKMLEKDVVDGRSTAVSQAVDLGARGFNVGPKR